MDCLDGFNSDRKDQLPYYSFQYFNSHALNKNKIEESNNIEDNYFSSKIRALETGNNNNITDAKQAKENASQEKPITNEITAPRNKRESQNFLGNINSYLIQKIDYGEIQNLKNNLNSQLGKKRRNENSSREHDRYSDDNLRRKLKNLLLNKILDFLNERIYYIYEGKIGNGPRKKELLSLNQNNKYNITIEFNKKFIYKTIGEIFSGDISSKYTSYLPTHNKQIIELLINEQDENKRLYFKKLFDIKFIQCVESFSGSKYYEELKDMKKFKDFKNSFKNDPKYFELLDYYLKNFEDIIKSKKGRQRKTKMEEEREKGNIEGDNFQKKLLNNQKEII